MSGRCPAIANNDIVHIAWNFDAPEEVALWKARAALKPRKTVKRPTPVH
ncbi:MAG TPA: hypothetical protein VFI79_12275 [Gemmatimonadales bacterium]|nr:hypothetical protein [Gemmatimonadales bacterium]